MVRRQLRQKIAAAFGKTMDLKRCGTHGSHPHVRSHWEFQCGAPVVSCCPHPLFPLMFKLAERAFQKCMGRLCSDHSEYPKSAVLSHLSWLLLQIHDEGLGVHCCLASCVAPSTPLSLSGSSWLKGLSKNVWIDYAQTTLSIPKRRF